MSAWGEAVKHAAVTSAFCGTLAGLELAAKGTLGGGLMAAGFLSAFGVEAVRTAHGVSANIISNRLYEALRHDEARLSSVVNHDIARAIGMTLWRIVTEATMPAVPVRKRLRYLPGFQRAWIALAETQGEAFEPLSEEAACEVLLPQDRAAGDAGPEVTFGPVEDTPFWKSLLSQLLADQSLSGAFQLSEDELASCAQACRDLFASRLFEAIKFDFEHAGKAFAAVHLRLMGQLIATTREIRDQGRETSEAVRAVSSHLDELIDAVTGQGERIVGEARRTGRASQVSVAAGWLSRLDGRLSRIEEALREQTAQVKGVGKGLTRVEHVTKEGFRRAEATEAAAHRHTRRASRRAAAVGAFLVVVAMVIGLRLLVGRQDQAADAARIQLALEIRRNLETADRLAGSTESLLQENSWPPDQFAAHIRALREQRAEHPFEDAAHKAASAWPSIVRSSAWPAVESAYQTIQQSVASDLARAERDLIDLCIQKPAPNADEIAPFAESWARAAGVAFAALRRHSATALEGLTPEGLATEPPLALPHLDALADDQGESLAARLVAHIHAHQVGPAEKFTAMLCLEIVQERLPKLHPADIEGHTALASFARRVGCDESAKVVFRRMIELFHEDAVMLEYARTGLDQLEHPERYHATKGLFVTDFAASRSAARDAGIRFDDVLISYDGRPLDLMDEFVDMIANLEKPQSVIVLVRKGETLRVTVPRGSLGVELVGF